MATRTLSLLVMAGALLQGRCLVPRGGSASMLLARGRPGLFSAPGAVAKSDSTARISTPVLQAQPPFIVSAASSECSSLEEESNKKMTGRPHTAESRARISAANKGNVPWNKGGAHSEETRREIGETTRRNAEIKKRAKLEAKLAELGLTEQEYNAQEAAKKAMPRNTTVSNEVRAKISAALKARWRNPEYRKEMKKKSSSRSRPHSEETKRKISETLKKKWEHDQEYRDKIMAYANNSSEETRSKISATLRARWADPDFRQRMTERRSPGPLSEEHRRRISEAVKAKWQEKEYREKAITGIKRSNAEGVSKPRKTTTTRRATTTKTPKARSKTTATTKRSVKAAASTTSSTSKPKNAMKKGAEKADPPVASAPAVDTDRIAQLKFSDPDLWAALYADDDDDYIPVPRQSQPPASPADDLSNDYISYGEEGPVTFDFDAVSGAPEKNRFSTVSQE